MTGAKQTNEEFTSLGMWFKSAREQRGECLESVSAITRISKDYLQAIEDDRLEKLPSPAYAKGFIRLYANHLGLSADKAFLLIDQNCSQEPEESASSNNDLTTNSGSCKSAAFRRIRKWGVPFILFVTVSLFAALPVLKQSKKRAPENERSTRLPPSPITVKPMAVVPQQQPLAGTKSTDSNAENPAAKGNPTAPGIILRLRAVQDGRIHIIIDGAVSQDYDLKIGDIIEWKAEKMFLLELDNAGAVEGELNGTRMKAFGEPGKAAHLTIQADTVQ